MFKILEILGVVTWTGYKMLYYFVFIILLGSYLFELNSLRSHYLIAKWGLTTTHLNKV